MSMQESEGVKREWMKPVVLSIIDENDNQKECFVMPSRGLKLIDVFILVRKRIVRTLKKP